MVRMNSESQDWLDQLVDQLNTQYPQGEIIVSSGHSPSGVYHIGTLREIMTAHAITWALKRIGRKARHLDFVDDFDAFRKVPAGVPEEWSKYVGVPLALVPDPGDCHESYGAHYLATLQAGLADIGVVPDEHISGYQNYQAGLLDNQMMQVFENLPQVKSILTEVGGRQLSDSWSPVQLLDDNNNVRTLTYTGWDSATKQVHWVDRAGKTGSYALDSGRVTLSWRLDWPARWAKWGVNVEPFGRDHATKGGSYDTGKVLVEQIYGGKAPFPVPYEFINTVGETKKMSKSSGNVLTPQQALQVMPAEILRYFVIKARPSRTLHFDSGLGLYTLIDEYTKAQAAPTTAALAYAQAAASDDTISTVPFNHLVSVFQTARQDVAAARLVLARTGYEAEASGQWPVLEREFGFVKNWLAHYAPAEVKFAVQDALPVVELSNNQRIFLTKLADTIEAESGLNGQGMHDAIYAASQVADIKPGQAFEAVYRVILGQDRGPKAGWFMASLETPWLVQRLREAATVQLAASKPSEKTAEVSLPDGRRLRIDPAISQAYPRAAVGYVVADVTVTDDAFEGWDSVRQHLAKQAITKDTLKDQPEIAAWREAYRSFGVKPSDYRSSVEALTRRVLDGKTVQVNNLVDVYNATSVEQGMPMGAMDLDHVTGDIVLRYGKATETATLFGLDKPVEVTPKQVVYADDKRIITWLWNYRDAPDTGVTLQTKRVILFIDSLSGAATVEPALRMLEQRVAALPGCTIAISGILA